MGDRKDMVGWYDPPLLVRTGIRVAVSTAFGQFADRREAIAAANAIEPQPFDLSFDYGEDAPDVDFWFDYLADTGDGWNPTYAAARLVAAPSLAPPGAVPDRLPRGRLLILGGDQVYPTASKKEYEDRFLAPFELAWERQGKAADQEKAPDLYAIPGNHDWYDGLNAFFGLFCRRRVALPNMLGISRPGRAIGRWRTQQTRSYFALRLPGDWWLWGTDSQLEGYIDQPQIDFFQHAASYWMAPRSKLILCVADPTWAYVDPARPQQKFDSFAFLERLAWIARSPDGARQRHRLKLILSGDSHHYARYVECDEGSDRPARHYVVCGGGGAFLHPTHHLRPEPFAFEYPPPGQDGGDGQRDFRIARDGADPKRESLYPDRATSSRLAWRNLAFAWFNRKFVLMLFAAYAMFNWLLDFTALTSGAGGLTESLRRPGWRDSLAAYADLVLTSPWPVILMGVGWAAYYYFADARTKAKRAVMGTLHAAAQLAAVTATIIAVLRWTAGVLPAGWDSLLSIALATALSALVSATVMGVYLLVSLNICGRHPNEGFSGLRIEHYKSFLRLRIARDGTLTLFPLGLDRVPDDRGGATGDPTERVRLIEQPIAIPPD